MRFCVKVPAIEEAKDVSKKTIDELWGSLQIYKINLNAQTKDKGIALQAEVNSPENVPYAKEEIMMQT